MKHPLNHIQFVLNNFYRFFNSFEIRAIDISISTILMKSLVHLLLYAEIINHKPFLFSGINTINTRYGLNQRVHL